MITSIVTNETMNIFDPNELDPFIQQINQIASSSSTTQTNVAEFQKNILATYASLGNVKAQFVMQKIDCIKTKLIQTLSL